MKPIEFLSLDQKSWWTKHRIIAFLSGIIPVSLSFMSADMSIFMVLYAYIIFPILLFMFFGYKIEDVQVLEQTQNDTTPTINPTSTTELDSTSKEASPNQKSVETKYSSSQFPLAKFTCKFGGNEYSSKDIGEFFRGFFKCLFLGFVVTLALGWFLGLLMPYLFLHVYCFVCNIPISMFRVLLREIYDTTEFTEACKCIKQSSSLPKSIFHDSGPKYKWHPSSQSYKYY